MMIAAVPAYKNAIWIRINNDNARWLYINVSPAGNKKARIISEQDLGCVIFPQVPSEYIQLPPNFNGPFAFYEQIRMANINYYGLIQEIVDRLPCVC
jgi:hypothetical protein